MVSDSPTDDFYELLGVDHDASNDAIKDAYRRKAKQSHPDQGGDTDHFRKLHEAYSVLSDSTARKEYDRSRKPSTSDSSEDGAAPYLSRSEIFWTADGRHPPCPETVRLSNHGGADRISQFGPERLSGDFWKLEENSECIMTGDDLYEFIVAPLNVDSMSPGTHQDEVGFFVDDQTVSVTVTLTIVTVAAGHAETTAEPHAPRADASSRRVPGGEPRRGAHRPTATPPPPTTSPSSTPPTRRRYHRLTEVIGRTIRTHLLIPAVASVVGSIWAESTLQTSEYSQPYGKAIVLLATIGCVTGIPALAASLVFDVSAWQRGAARFAIVDIPEWHRHLLFASAILPPAVYLVAHWGEKFADYGPRYGPPQLFWWLAPVGLLVAHLAALCRRAMTER